MMHSKFVATVLRTNSIKRFAVTTTLAFLTLELISLIASSHASAQAILSCPGQNGIDALPNVFCTNTATWLGNGLAYAQHLFVILLGIELAWSAILWVFQKEQLGELLSSFIVKMMALWFFYAIILFAPRWLPEIMSSFISLGGVVTGQPISLNPQHLLDLGVAICNQVFSNLPQPRFYFSLTSSGVEDNLFIAFAMLIAVIFAAITCLMVFTAFLIAAGQLVMTLVEAYVMVGAGAVFLGFTGSRWTLSFGEKWIGYAISIGIKLFVTYVIIALGMTLFPANCPPTAGSDPSGVCNYISQIHMMFFHGLGEQRFLGPMVQDYLLIAATAFIFMLLCMRLPSLAASMMNGSPNLSLQGAGGAAGSVAGAVAGGATAAMGVAKTVLTGPFSAAKSGVSAVSSAANALKGGGGIASSTSSGTNIAGSAAGKTAGGPGNAASKSGGVGGASAGTVPRASAMVPAEAKHPQNRTTAALNATSGSSLAPAGVREDAAAKAVNHAGDAVKHAGNTVAAPIAGSAQAASAALKPLTEMDEGGGGGSVAISLRMPE